MEGRNMKIWIYFLILIILLTLFPGCGEKKESPEIKTLEPNLEETEPNDSPAQAHAVKDGTYAKGFIGAQKDQDWYKISIPPDSNAILKAVLAGVPGINLKMELFNSDQVELLDVNKNKEDQGEMITNQGLTTGDYFLRVRELWAEGKERKFNDTTAYHLHIHLLSNLVTCSHVSCEFILCLIFYKLFMVTFCDRHSVE